MPTVIEDSPQVRFEGYSPGTEIWGSTQANFLVQLPGRHAREVAVLLNVPAGAALAAAAGREDNAEFREEAARAVGEAVLEDVVGRGVSFDSIITVSEWFLAEHPGIFERSKAALSK